MTWFLIALASWYVLAALFLRYCFETDMDDDADEVGVRSLVWLLSPLLLPMYLIGKLITPPKRPKE